MNTPLPAVSITGWLKKATLHQDGPGILPNDLPHIFERSYPRPDNSTPGEGLGLAIVQSIAQAHGWRVKVENNPQGGSKFTLEM